MKETRQGIGETLTPLRQYLEQYTGSRSSFEAMLGDFSPDAQATIMRGHDIAELCHRETPKRKDGRDFITHPVSAALIAIFYGVRNVDEILKHLLHDTGEDSNHWANLKISYESRIKSMRKKISAVFGENVADGVVFSTNFTSKDVSGRTHRTRKANAIRKTHKKFINGTREEQRSKLPDRLHNILTLKYVGTNKAKRKIRDTEKVYIPMWKEATKGSPIYGPMLVALEAAVKEAKREVAVKEAKRDLDRKA